MDDIDYDQELATIYGIDDDPPDDESEYYGINYSNEVQPND